MIDQKLYQELREQTKKNIENNDIEEELAFFQRTFNKNSFNTQPNNIIKIDLCDLAIIMLCQKTNLSYQQIQEKIMHNRNFIKEVTAELLQRMIIDIEELNIEELDIEEMKQIQQEIEKENGKRNNQEINNFIQDVNLGFNNLIELCTLAKKETVEVLKVIRDIKILKFQREILNIDFQKYNISSSMKEMIFKEVINNLNKNKIVDLDLVTQSIHEAKKYLQKIIEKKEKESKKRKKSILNYINVEEWLQNQDSNQEIKEISPFIKKIPEENLRIQILQNIYRHNLAFQQKIEKEYQKISKESINQIYALCKQYGIDPLQVKIDGTKDFAEMSQILKTLCSWEIENPCDLVQILNTTSLSMINKIKDMINKGYIIATLIQDHQEIFYEGSREYQNLIANIAICQEKGISPYVIQKANEVLLIDTNKWQKNIEILKNYQLINNLKNAQSLAFLKESNLDKKIDEVLELGMEPFLEEELSLLNFDQKQWKKILLLTRLNMSINTTNELLAILMDKNFIIEESILDDYLYDAKVYAQKQNPSKEISKEKLDEVLKKYIASNRTYYINGVIISQNKVRRNLETNPNQTLYYQEILDSITEGKKFTEDEYEKIQTQLEKDLFITTKSEKPIQKRKNQQNVELG